MARPRLTTTALLFILFQGIYGLTASGNAFHPVPDEFETYFQVEHLVDEGDLSVPQTLELKASSIVEGELVAKPIFFGKLGSEDKRPWAPYGPLAAPLALPHHLAARATAAVLGVARAPLDKSRAWLILVSALTSLATTTAGALAVAGFHRAARAIGAGPGRALALSLLLGLATPLWPYAHCFYSEAWLAALLVWAAALLLEARAGVARGEALVAVAALLVFAAGLVKATAIVALPFFALAAALDRDVDARARSRAAFLLGVAVAFAALAHVAWNVRRFGVPLDFGYAWTETIAANETPRPFALGELPRGLVVLLLTPGKSLVFWAPCLVLAAARARAFASSHRAIAIALGAALATALVFYGSYMFPEGGYCHGPRHLVPLVPLLLLPAATGGEPSRRALILCAALGGALAIGATAVSFVEDQTVDVGATRTDYYERVRPEPGRPWNRYRLGYVPFARALASWRTSDALPGSGPDLLPVLIARARSVMNDGSAIPGWLPLAYPVPWLILIIIAIRRLARGDTG
jgi:hypothetical protein